MGRAEPAKDSLGGAVNFEFRSRVADLETRRSPTEGTASQSATTGSCTYRRMRDQRRARGSLGLSGAPCGAICGLRHDAVQPDALVYVSNREPQSPVHAFDPQSLTFLVIDLLRLQDSRG